MADATIIQFPTGRIEKVTETEIITRSCMDCTHVAFGNSGIYCTLFRESLVSDTVAEECSEFEPV